MGVLLAAHQCARSMAGCLASRPPTRHASQSSVGQLTHTVLCHRPAGSLHPEHVLYAEGQMDISLPSCPSAVPRVLSPPAPPPWPHLGAMGPAWSCWLGRAQTYLSLPMR